MFNQSSLFAGQVPNFHCLDSSLVKMACKHFSLPQSCTINTTQVTGMMHYEQKLWEKEKTKYHTYCLNDTKLMNFAFKTWKK